MIEMFLRKNPFNGVTYKDSIKKNFAAKIDWISMKILGITDECIEFMKGMLTSDPHARYSDEKCLRHGVFTRIDPIYDEEPLNPIEIMKTLNPPNSRVKPMPIYGLDLLNSVQLAPQINSKDMVNFDSALLKSQIMNFKFDGPLPVPVDATEDNLTLRSFSVFWKKNDHANPVGSVSALFLGSQKDSVSQACPTESNYHQDSFDQSIRELKRPPLLGSSAILRRASVGSVDSMYTMTSPHLIGRPRLPTIVSQHSSNLSGMDKVSVLKTTRRRSTGVAIGSFVNSERSDERSEVGSDTKPARVFDQGKSPTRRVSKFRTVEPTTFYSGQLAELNARQAKKFGRVDEQDLECSKTKKTISDSNSNSSSSMTQSKSHKSNGRVQDRRSTEVPIRQQ